jgi:hypothetical protein
MVKHKYLSNFDFFFYDPTPFLACWIVTTPFNVQLLHVMLNESSVMVFKCKKNFVKFMLPLTKFAIINHKHVTLI